MALRVILPRWRFSRFRSEADMDRQPKPAKSVESDLNGHQVAGFAVPRTTLLFCLSTAW
jgi:hypothetical protein